MLWLAVKSKFAMLIYRLYITCRLNSYCTGTKYVIKPKSLYHFVPRYTVGAWGSIVSVWCLLLHLWTNDV